MRQSILQAIRSGNWSYEPDTEFGDAEFDATSALPGSDQKLQVLAERVAQGLPLWHPEDRVSFVVEDVDERLGI